MVLVLFLISVATFFLFEAIPNGSPALRLAGRTASTAEIHQIEVKYGFNKPVYVQYVNTMKNIFTGQAYSYTNGFYVWPEIKAGLPATLSLAIGAGILWLITSIIVGTFAAIRAGRYTDRVLTVLAMIGVSLPPFFFGALLLYFLGYKAGIFPLGASCRSPPVRVSGSCTSSCRGSHCRSCSSASTRACCARRSWTRSARTTCALRRRKGSRPTRCCSRHTLRNSMIPIFSLWALDVAQVIGGGAILTETVFSLHGVGQLAASAIEQEDIITILVITMFLAFVVVFVQALMDIGYALLDPRIGSAYERHAHGSEPATGGGG